MQPAASIVVVSYNSGAHLEPCLRSLCADTDHPPRQVLVIDNASTDESVDIARRFAQGDDRVRVIENERNLGYAGAVNAALPYAQGRYVGVLNPDMIVGRGWLAPLVEFLDNHPETGAVNPLVLLAADPSRINAAGQHIHVTALGFNRAFRQRADRIDPTPVRVSGIQGGAFLVRRSLLERMGGWDDAGFLYHEDVELSWLLALMGYDLYCLPESVVRHDYHLSMYPEKLYLLERNRWAMLGTHLHGGTLLLLSPLLILTECMMWGYCLLRGARFLQAKLASCRWVRTRRKEIAARRQRVEALRTRGDWRVLRRLKWGYAWGQLLSLGRERGESLRKPVGGPTVRFD